MSFAVHEKKIPVFTRMRYHSARKRYRFKLYIYYVNFSLYFDDGARRR